MKYFDKDLAEELNAKTEIEYGEKKDVLESYITTKRQKLKQISTITEFYEFCLDFAQNCEFDRPIDFESDNKETEHYEKLKAFNYPKDFLEWHKLFGNTYLWLESTKIKQTNAILSEITDGYYGLLTHNGYMFITSDGGGNGFFYDTNNKVNEILFLDHTGYYSLDEESIEELYSEEFGFWFDEDQNNYVNEQNLEPQKIMNSNKAFIKDSIYIKEYLKANLKSTGCSDFLTFLKRKTEEGFRNILHRYGINQKNS